VPFNMARVGHVLLTLVGGACLTVACSSTTPRDKNFNTDAESGFEPPPVSQPDGSMDTQGTSTAGTAGAAGTTTGAAGAAGGSAGSDADAAPPDAPADAVSDGGPG
jgi:hypothetical protein